MRSAQNHPQQAPNGRQLEIFPLHPGTNPARPEGDSRRSNTVRGVLARIVSGRPLSRESRSPMTSTDREPRTADLDRPVSRWKVARGAWQAVERMRARRDGVATLLQQATAAAVSSRDLSRTELEVDEDQLTTMERMLAFVGFLVGMALLVSGI
ncbi:MAG: hypothetical protein VX404_07810 [Planctomycetota bacterium]|nr:hypothetical protein [Planctomycetota bacterium]